MAEETEKIATRIRRNRVNKISVLGTIDNYIM